MNWESLGFLACAAAKARKNSALKHSPQRGQASVLFVLVFLTLFVFFAFVVNLGLIIHHKINLQQTADLAAYAGAAWQARAMNTIAIENFRMRQDYKEYVFHQWFTFSRGSEDWASAVDDGKGTEGLGSGYFAPITCVAWQGYKYFGDETMYCRKLWMNYSPVQQLTVVDESDTLAITVQQALKDLGIQVKTVCEAGQKENEAIYKWLQTRYIGTVADPGLLRRRARHIAQLTEKFNNAVSEDPIRNSNSSLDEVVKQTVLNNLTSSLRAGLNTPGCTNCGVEAALPDTGIVVEAPPSAFPTATAPQFLKLKLLSYSFASGYARFTATGNEGACDVSVDKSGAKQSIFQNKDIPVMFRKDETVLTYYALRLRSQPRLLYLPQSWSPVLTAYAAAKPFGGRIGPDVQSVAYRSSVEGRYNLSKDGRTPFAQNCGASGDECPFANVAFFPSDEHGWGRTRTRKNLADLLGGQISMGLYAKAGGTEKGSANYFPGLEIFRNITASAPFDGGRRAPGHPLREVTVAARGPNDFDAYHFSLFPTPAMGTADPIDNNIAYQFPGGAAFESDETSELRLWDSALGANLFGALTSFRVSGDVPSVSSQISPVVTRVWGTEQMRLVPPYTNCLVNKGECNRGLDYSKYVSSWAPSDELMRVEQNQFTSNLLFGNAPGWGRTGYSVKLTNFRSLKGGVYFTQDRDPAATNVPSVANLRDSFLGDPNVPESGATEERKLLH